MSVGEFPKIVNGFVEFRAGIGGLRGRREELEGDRDRSGRDRSYPRSHRYSYSTRYSWYVKYSQVLTTLIHSS